MATQQHPALDAVYPTLANNFIRVKSRKKLQSTAQHECVDMQNQALQLCAQAEARTWKLRAESERIRAFEKSWKATRSVIESRLRRAGSDLSGRYQQFLDNAKLIRQSAQRIKAAVKDSREIQQIEIGKNEYSPRAYAAVVSYLRATQTRFEEDSFGAFFTALQEIATLEPIELWKLRPYLEMELLKLVADAKCGSPELVALFGSLRRINDVDWKDLLENINVVERVLHKDPCGAYALMDSETRAAYREMIAHYAKRTGLQESEIASQVVELARRSPVTSEQRVQLRQQHVGYYLVGDGKAVLERDLGYRGTITERARKIVQRRADLAYLASIGLLTFAVLALAASSLHPNFVTIILMGLFLFPAAECSISLINHWATMLFPPRVLPKLDFKTGVPLEFATVVAVPTLLTSEQQMRRAVRDLEIRFLANRDANLHFALLTDPPDAAQQFDEKDDLAGECATLIESLNEKYSAEGRGSFFLFHRHRSYNESEGVWMGWERKRGKLLDLNKLLLGTGDNFPVKAGKLSTLRDVKYVITLDLDTQLPRDVARKLVGAIAHPLNRAVIDPSTNVVVDGYGILQPRVDISVQSARRSRLASVLSGDAGLDIYTRAVSDVYQDLFAEGSFTGKGIYEVATFQRVLEHRFPCNAILSHDMIEGSYARAGLVSDLEVVDDYPSHISALSRRKHRWVRGDWQIVFWLLPRVPDFFGKMVRNPLSIISRWKILDNLRRSLTEMATFLMLLGAWLFLPGKAMYWTAATLVAIALPTYAQFLTSIARGGLRLFSTVFWKNLAADFVLSQMHLFLRVVFLCHQSLVTVDAVVRSIVRMTVTHEQLLEWETADEAELNNKKSPVETYFEAMPWISLFVGLLLAVERPGAFLVSLPLLILWGLSKPIGQWLNLPPKEDEAAINSADRALLRMSALRTWRLFREFSTEEENGLIPDNIQEPASLIEHRVSTTNLGLLLNARLAAVDLGFLTVPEFVEETEKTFDAVDRMPKLDGQLYNWYDTRTLDAVTPKFVSTVDNGNLVCCLWTVKQGSLEAVKGRIFRREIFQGIIDYLDTIAGMLKSDAEKQKSLIASIRAMKELTEPLGDSLAAWASALPILEKNAAELATLLYQDPCAAEAGWWAHELRLRIWHIESLFHDFAPWHLPQFAKHYGNYRLESIIGTKPLTLESLPELCSRLDDHLAALSVNSDAEADAAVRLLRSAIDRTSGVSRSLGKKLERLAARADRIANAMDFSVLYNAKKRLLTTGYDAESGALTSSHYELLASEARAAVFVAIAKGDIPQEAWMELDRQYTRFNNEHVMRSWSGTTFEYLMPLLWTKSYSNTLLDQVTQRAINCQRKYGEAHGIPWGISEASCAKINSSGHFHYEAFGIPELAVNPELSTDVVVSPYSTFLGLLVDAGAAVENIRRMHKLGWLGSYGFYESVDFTPSRLVPGKKGQIVHCWLAHHQGMSLVAVANTLCNASSQRRFHAEPRVAATERLLHEKAPRATRVNPSEAEELRAAAILGERVKAQRLRGASAGGQRLGTATA
ncbi:MAG: hypothetical protein NVS9B4_09510 [Candidatus Acidiferrum sp.]